LAQVVDGQVQVVQNATNFDFDVITDQNRHSGMRRRASRGLPYVHYYSDRRGTHGFYGLLDGRQASFTDPDAEPQLLGWTVSRPPYLNGSEHWVRALCEDATGETPRYALFSAVPSSVTP
jgi:hypothetical protein